MSTRASDDGAREHVIRGTVVMETDRCKGCELCIPACRPGVLVMSSALNEAGYHFPLLLEGCTGCRACHAVCPDYVFDVYKFETPIVVTTTELADDAPAEEDR